MGLFRERVVKSMVRTARFSSAQIWQSLRFSGPFVTEALLREVAGAVIAATISVSALKSGPQCMLFF